MKKHTRVYIEHFYGGDLTDICCEICKVMHGDHTKAVDVHHLTPRRSGSSKLVDIPEKLIAVCRDHHTACENLEIDTNAQIFIHIQFAEDMRVEIDKDKAYMNLHELTKLYKDGHV